jgi:hypothetical protein
MLHTCAKKTASLRSSAFAEDVSESKAATGESSLHAAKQDAAGLPVLKTGERQMKSWIQRCYRSSRSCAKSRPPLDCHLDLVASATSS